MKQSWKDTPRLLGAAFLLVFVASILSSLLKSAVEASSTTSEVLVSISDNLVLWRISILFDLATSVGIVALAVLLYVIFSRQSKIMALVALGWWLAEAIILAVSKIGSYALIPLSKNFVAAGAPNPSDYLTLGDFLYFGIDRVGYDLHMMFFVLGGILWYFMFFKSRYVPRALAAWGLAAVCLLSVNVVWVLYDRDLGGILVLGLPYLVFEALIGPWLIVKGIKNDDDSVGG